MNTLMLDKYELFELTGSKRTTTQVEWLNKNAIPFLIGADEKPKVLRATIESLLTIATRSVRKREPRLHLIS